MKKLLRQYWPFLIWIVLAAVIFAPAFGKYVMFPCPDSPPQSLSYRVNAINEILSGTASLALHDLLPLVLSPFAYNDLTYPIDLLLAALGFAYFLSGRGIPRPAAVFAGGVFAFMGYSLTLFSAGHRSYFFMMPYEVFLFAFLTRAIDGKGLVYYPLAAFCATWLLRFGPDVGTVFLGVAVIYAIFLLCRQCAGNPEGKPAVLRKFLIGALLGLATFALVAAPTIYHSATSLLAGRKAQIEQSAPITDAANKATGETAQNDRNDAAWIFATNWSLPPDETLELVAPAVKGNQTGDPAAPYWGRLGRTWKWEETHQGYINFRQHVVYLGAIPVALALFAVLGLFIPGVRRNRAESPECAFWAIAFVLGLLLAFGRYTPFYRLFYAIPGMSFLRAPVKFIRLVEFSTAALAGFGVARLLAAEAEDKSRRIFTFAAAGLAAAFAVFALVVHAAPGAFCAPLKEIGGESIIPVMARKSVGALLHAVVGFGLVAVVSALAQRHRINANFALGLLAAAVATDVALVARPFAFAYDFEYQYTDKNPVTAEALKARPCPSVTVLIGQPQLEEAQRNNQGKNGVGSYPRKDLDHMQFLSQPEVRANGMARMMELTGSTYALMPASQARNMLGAGLEPLFGVSPRNPPALFAKTNTPGKDDYMLFKVSRPKPYARLYAHWTSAPEEGFLAEVAHKMGPADANVVVIRDDTPCDDTHADGSAETLKVQGVDGALETLIRTKSNSTQVMATTRGYNKDNVVTVDGAPARQFMAGYAGTGVFVPAGEHLVAIRSKPRNLPVSFFSMAMFVLFLGLAALAVRNARKAA